MSFPIIDLHSDLLCFLIQQEGRSIEDPLSRNSFAQMSQGNVKIQTLAIYSRTCIESIKRMQHQLTHFQNLLTNHPQRFIALRNTSDIKGPLIHLIPAIENGSVFAQESEQLSTSLARLEQIINLTGHLFYISMTWDGENRFGGGVGASTGLKRDGQLLLSWLSSRRIAIDLSHTSDRLATGIIEYIDKYSLDIPLIASHSNFRSVHAMPRNLPSAIAKEIIKRKGLIGLNFFAPFIHQSDPNTFLRHVEYGLELGAKDALCFGADFFCDSDFPSIKQKYPNAIFFFDIYGNSSCYPSVLHLFSESLKLDSRQLEAIAYKNAWDFLKKSIL